MTFGGLKRALCLLELNQMRKLNFIFLAILLVGCLWLGAGSERALSENGQFITLKNPAFAELRDFILNDFTSRHSFILNQYECRHFATEVNNNAEAAGIRCALVLLCFKQGQHAVVAFDTPDKGLVYIEPQTDAAIHPEVGTKYQGKEIKEILIVW